MAERNNDNGRKYDRWWIQTLVTLGTMLLAVGIAYATLKSEVGHTAIKDAEQDKCIERNAADIRRIDNMQTRIDERLKTIQRDVGTLVERGDGS